MVEGGRLALEGTFWKDKEAPDQRNDERTVPSSRAAMLVRDFDRESPAVEGLLRKHQPLGGFGFANLPLDLTSRFGIQSDHAGVIKIAGGGKLQRPCPRFAQRGMTKRALGMS
jgi:hypothetical protein